MSNNFKQTFKKQKIHLTQTVPKTGKFLIILPNVFEKSIKAKKANKRKENYTPVSFIRINAKLLNFGKPNPENRKLFYTNNTRMI